MTAFYNDNDRHCVTWLENLVAAWMEMENEQT